MKSLWNMFINSLKLPKKQAVFTLNRLGMDTIVFYLFILLAISSIPTFIQQLNENEQLSPFFFFIFFFIFHYLIIVLVIFVSLSIIAWVGVLFTKIVHRKLRYSILWKMTASAATIPIIFFTFISIIKTVQTVFLIISVLFVFLMLGKIILIYPRRKHL